MVCASIAEGLSERKASKEASKSEAVAEEKKKHKFNNEVKLYRMATAEISAKDVFKLRKQTGAGMMDCKKALQESDGDFDAAIDYLRKKGQKLANKRADREASEGYALAKSFRKQRIFVGALIVKRTSLLKMRILEN